MKKSVIRRILFLILPGLLLMGMPVFAEQGKININTANEKQLCELKRVSNKYAARIIQYRKEVGPFQAPDEIMKVRGIGPKTFEANKAVIIVQEVSGEVRSE